MCQIAAAAGADGVARRQHHPARLGQLAAGQIRPGGWPARRHSRRRSAVLPEVRPCRGGWPWRTSPAGRASWRCGNARARRAPAGAESPGRWTGRGAGALAAQGASDRLQPGTVRRLLAAEIGRFKTVAEELGIQLDWTETDRWTSPGPPSRTRSATASAPSAPLRRRLLARTRPRRRLPARLPPRDRRCRLARHLRCPQEYGGAGLGITEAAIMMHDDRESGAGMAAARRVHMNIFGPQPDRRLRHRRAEAPHGCRADRRARTRPASASPSPMPASNTTRSRPSRGARGDRYLVTRPEVWTSTAQVASKMLLLARTTPLEDCASRPTASRSSTPTSTAARSTSANPEDGPQGGRFERSSSSTTCHPGRGPHRRGGQGLPLHPAQPEPGAPAGRRRSHRASARTRCAAPRIRERTRRVRPADRPEPGHPAPARRTLDGARGGLGDDDEGAPGCTTSSQPCGAEANAAKFLAARAGYDACQQAVLTHGGFGYAKEYHVERCCAK